MSSQPLHLINNSRVDSKVDSQLNVKVKIRGNVSIDPTVAIASGVLLQADSSSQIIIGAGVCIGAGTIIHAFEGIIEIGVGVAIAAEVLIVGKSKIGDRACIGAGVTIYNHDVAVSEVLVASALVGEFGRQESLESPAIAAKITEPYSIAAAFVQSNVDIKTELKADSIQAPITALKPEDPVEPQVSENQLINPQKVEYKSTYVYESVQQVPITGLEQPQLPEIQPEIQKVEYKSSYVYEPTQQVPIAEVQTPEIQKVEYKSTYTYDTPAEQKLPTPNAPTNGDGESRPKVYGKANLDNLLAKLLPHRQALNQPLPE